MARHRAPRRSPRRTPLALTFAAAATAAAAWAVPSGPSPAAAGVGSATSAAAAEVVSGSADARRAGAPTRVRVPAVGIDSTLMRLGLDADGVLDTPPDFDRAGWYAGGPAPGEVGPAVIAGHVDSVTGPAVFFRLAETAAGDEVLVERDDGTTARFTVTRVERYPKDRFPTEEVYGPTPGGELRLITCGGDFDRAARSYEDNVVVYARSA